MGYAGQVLSLVAIPLYLRTMGVENYGLMLAALALSHYFTMTDGGLSWGSMILMAHAHGRRDRAEMAHIFRHGLVLALASGLLAMLIAVAVWMAAGSGWRLPMFAGNSISDRLILIVGAQAATSPLIAMFYNVFFSMQEAQRPALYQGAARLLGTLVGIGAILVWRGEPWIVLACNLAVTLVAATVTALILWRRHPWIFARGSCRDTRQFERQLRTGGKNFFLQLARVLSATAPVLVLSSFAGPATVPLYTLSLTLIQLVLAPLQSWAAYAQTAYGEAWAAGQKDWVVETFRRTLHNTMLISGIVLAVVVPLIGPAVALISGGRLIVPPLMCLGVAVSCTVGVFVTTGQYLLTGLNRQRHAALAELGSGITGFAFCVLGVYYWGPDSVGWGFALAASLTSVWVLRREICRHLEIERLPVSSAHVWRVIAGLVLTTLLVRLWPQNASLSISARVVELAVTALVGTTIYGGWALAFGTLSWQEIRSLCSRRQFI